MPVKDDAEGFDNEVADRESPHLEGDDEEEEDAGIGCDEVEGREDSKEAGGGSDHRDFRQVTIKKTGQEEEQGVEEGSGDAAEEVKGEVGAAGHPALDVRAKEEESEAIGNEVTEARVEKLEGHKSPNLEFVDSFLDAKCAHIFHEKAIAGIGHEDLQKKNSGIDDEKPLRHRGPFEGAGYP